MNGGGISGVVCVLKRQLQFSGKSVWALFTSVHCVMTSPRVEIIVNVLYDDQP